MAKSKQQQESDDKAQVVKDEATAERAYQKTLDERVAEVLDQPEPTDVEPEPEPLTPVEQFLKDAREAQDVFSAGNPVSIDLLKSLVARAITLLTPTP